MSEHAVEIDLDRRGRGTIKIGGQDVSDSVLSISLEASNTDKPQVVVRLQGAVRVNAVADVLAVTDLVVPEQG